VEKIKSSKLDLKSSASENSHQASHQAKERLLESALRLFAMHGFDGTSVRDIAEAASLNLSLISYYFDGKAGLYRACIEGFGRTRSEKARALLFKQADSYDEFRVRIELLIEEMITFQIENPYPCQMIQREIDEGLPRARDIFEDTLLKTYGLLVVFIRTAQDNGFVDKSVDPMIVTSYLQGSIFHIARTDNIRKQFFSASITDPEVKKKHIDQLVHLFFNGIQERKKSL
jgi:AcrR family transcriptional regulator